MKEAFEYFLEVITDILTNVRVFDYCDIFLTSLFDGLLYPLFGDITPLCA